MFALRSDFAEGYGYISHPLLITVPSDEAQEDVDF